MAFGKKCVGTPGPLQTPISLYTFTSNARFTIIYPIRLHGVMLRCRVKFNPYSTSTPLHAFIACCLGAEANLTPILPPLPYTPAWCLITGSSLPPSCLSGV